MTKNSIDKLIEEAKFEVEIFERTSVKTGKKLLSVVEKQNTLLKQCIQQLNKLNTGDLAHRETTHLIAEIQTLLSQNSDD